MPPGKAAGNGSAAAVTGSEVFDLTAAASAALGEITPFPFTYKGGSYEIPPQTAWPLSAMAKLAAGDIETAMSELIGPANYLRLVDAGLTVGEMNVLMNEAAKHGGLAGLPNSSTPAPPGSSRT